MSRLSQAEREEIANRLDLRVDENGRITKPGYRIDETDETVVSFSPFFSAEDVTEYTYKTTDGEYLILLRPQEQDTKIRDGESEGDINWIEIRDMQDREENIRRDTVGTIIHYPDEGENHIIRIERDMENQQVEGLLLSFHLNLMADTGDDIQELCPTCWRKLEPLDHMEIRFTDGMGEGYKFPDWEATYEEIRKRLYEAGLHPE